MTAVAQQKLLLWLKNTVAPLVTYRPTNLEHEDIILQKLTDTVLPAAKPNSSGLFVSFVCCYDNPHDKDEMDQRLDNWKWSKTIPETLSSFNEVVHIWTQAAQQTDTLDFAHQVEMSTHHSILEQIVRKIPKWGKKHMKEHKEEEANRMTRSSTGNIHVLTIILHDRETCASILTMSEAILPEESEHVDASAPVALGYGDATAPMSLGLHFLGQQFPWGPNGEFECMRCDDVNFYRKYNAPVPLEELGGQHAST